MTFHAGNALGKLKKTKPQSKTQSWFNVVGWLIGDGGHKFKEILVRLSMGQQVLKEEKEFLQHYKDLLEYFQPKLSRKTLVGDRDNPITLDILLDEIEKETKK